jgi:hypothetical protein
MEPTNTGMLTLEEQFAIQTDTAQDALLNRARLANEAWIATQCDQLVLKFKQEMSRIFGVYVGNTTQPSVEMFGVIFHLNSSQELCVSKKTVTGAKLFTEKVPHFAAFWDCYNHVIEQADQESGLELIKICSKWWRFRESAINVTSGLVELLPLAKFVHDLYAKSGDSLKVDSTIEFDEYGSPVPTFHVYTDGFTEKDLDLLSAERGDGFLVAEFYWHPMSSAPR